MSLNEEMTTVRVRRRTAHAVNSIAGLGESGTTADDIVWNALKIAFPEEMEHIEKLQKTREDAQKSKKAGE
jgi:hypothetical protein